MARERNVGNPFLLDEAATERFPVLVNDEGIMRAGFVAHEADHLNDGRVTAHAVTVGGSVHRTSPWRP